LGVVFGPRRQANAALRAHSACSLKKNGMPIGGLMRFFADGCQKLTSSNCGWRCRNEYQSKSVIAT
jgi:hypothetical protein